jgi:hypothetical protein
MVANDLNPWQVMARRPAPLAKLVESETERLLAARKPASGGRESPPATPVQPAETAATPDVAEEPS